MACYEFLLMKQLQVNGSHKVFIKTGETKFVMVARGYTAYDDLKPCIENTLDEMAG